MTPIIGTYPALNVTDDPLPVNHPDTVEYQEAPAMLTLLLNES
jgi:hypothetical protein